MTPRTQAFLWSLGCGYLLAASCFLAIGGLRFVWGVAAMVAGEPVGPGWSGPTGFGVGLAGLGLLLTGLGGWHHLGVLLYHGVREAVREAEEETNRVERE